MVTRRILTLLTFLGLLAAPSAVGAVAGVPGLSKLARDSTRALVVRTDPGESVPSFVMGRIPVERFTSSASATARGWDFWETYGRAFGVANPRAELVLRSVERDDLGMTHLEYDQVYEDLDVFGRRLLIHLDGGAVTVINGEFTPNIGFTTIPSVSADEARAEAREALPARRLLGGGPPPQLLIHVDRSERARLAWLVTVGSEVPLGVWQVFVDARMGETITFYNDLHTAKNRTIYTNGNDPDCNTTDAPQCVLPGTLVRSEGGAATGDPVIDDNYAHTGTTYDYLFGAFARDSYDGAGHTIRSTVHFGSGYNNAFWCDDLCASFFGSTPDGEQIVFGDGNGTVFSPLSRDIDVVSHELTHGLTSSEANLIYQEQSGALNESYSDVFAAMVDTGDWLIGEDSFTPSTPGDALRNMADPSAEGQPEHMSEYEETIYDAGGVHINSGIPNHAAFLTSEGPGYGIGRASTQQIYYRALTTYLTPSSDFLDNLNALHQSADDLFAGTAEMTAVARANATVGIVNPPAVTFPNGGETLPSGSAQTITWTANDNARPFKVAYLQDLGTMTYAQPFGGASLPTEFTTEGNAPWSVSGVDPSPGGGNNVRSGVITHNQRSELSLDVRLAASGSVSFRYRVSSELNFDFLSFYIDGEEVFARSGNVPWSINSEPLAPGPHTLTWVYEKDFIVSSGGDVARIDDISVANAENVALTTINASTAPGATSQAWTTPTSGGSVFKVRVETLGVALWYASDDSNGTFTVDDTDPPETTITSGPSGPTNDPTPTFGFSSDEPGSTFMCKVDLDPFAPCTSPHTTTALTDDAHTFEVKATDMANNEDPTPDTQAFTVDTDPPETTITSAPPDPTTPTPTFHFTSDEVGTFSCRVDSNPFLACATPHTTAPLSAGPHTFEVKAIDTAGNEDPDPATHGFAVIDTDPPETAITSGPSGATTDATPTFEFSSDELGSTFNCRVDSAPFAVCTSPHTTAPLGEGSHTFEVKAKDPSDNEDPTAASRSFTVIVASVSIGDAKKKEPDKGKKAMKFTVTLSGAASSPVTVSFATKNGTAKAPKDYKKASGTLTFPAGTTSLVVKVMIKGDTLDEKNEKLKVVLSAPSGATIADGTAIGTIKDND